MDAHYQIHPKWPGRFNVIKWRGAQSKKLATFSTFEEAEQYVKELRKAEEFNLQEINQ